MPLDQADRMARETYLAVHRAYVESKPKLVA
jgi:hypothetical protein